MRLATTILAFVVFGPVPTAGADEIALSLVHGDSRIDVPASAIVSINVWGSTVYRNSETGSEFESKNPVVEICLSERFKSSICQLTRRSLQEPLEIWVSCRVVSKPVVHEAICSSIPCIDIGIYDLEDAERLAAELKAEPKLACP